MGKPSTPTPPTAPTAPEIAAANIQTAEHMAKLSRAMEFGEELMRDVRNEDGTRVKYSKVKTDVPTGYEPQYSHETVSTSGPTAFSMPFGNKGGSVKAGVNPNGELSGFIYKPTASSGAIPYTEAAALEGKSWHSEEVQSFLKGKGWEGGFAGSQPLTTQVKTLTGYKNPADETDIRTANQYYKSTYNKAGDLVGKPELVDRNDAVDVDFAGMGDIDRAVKRAEWEQEYGMKHADFLLDFSEQYGDQFVEEANRLLESSDQTGYDARELLGQLAMDHVPGELPDLPKLKSLADPALLERVGVAPLLEQVDLETQLPDYTTAGEFGDLGRLEAGDVPAFEELKRAEAPQFGDLGGVQPFRLDRAADYTGGAPAPAAQAPDFGFGAPSDLDTAISAPEDPRGFLGADVAALEGAELDAPPLTAGQRGVPTLERLTQEQIGEIPIDPDSLEGRRFLESQLLGRAESGRTSRLMAEEARRIARRRAAATGNIFGGGAVIEEAARVREAEDVGQRAAMSDLVGFLSSGQTAGDYQAQVAQQNLANRLTGIEQRTGATTGEFGMGMQALTADQQAAAMERADELALIQNKTTAEQQEFENLGRIVEQINQARAGQFDVQTQQLDVNTRQRMAERQDELALVAQRNEAQEAEYQSLLAALGQRAGARQTGFAMDIQRADQLNQAAQAEFQRKQQAVAQQNQAAQQAYASAAQKTLTQEQQKQQQISNLQSFSGLQPVAAQYGLTGVGAQQSAAGLTGGMAAPTYQATNVAGLLQGQQQLASNTFGTQANIWGQQAQMAMQPSGAGQAAGAILGGFAGGFGQKAFSKAFPGQ